MNLGNNRVWDYVGDNFVHRLVQNKGDGKLVEGSSPGKLDVQFMHTYINKYWNLELCVIYSKYDEFYFRIQTKRSNLFN